MTLTFSWCLQITLPANAQIITHGTPFPKSHLAGYYSMFHVAILLAPVAIKWLVPRAYASPVRRRLWRKRAKCV